MGEKILKIKCKCGNPLKESYSNVEFFGLDLGKKNIEICTKCKEEYLDDEVMGGIETELRKRKIL